MTPWAHKSGTSLFDSPLTPPSNSSDISNLDMPVVATDNFQAPPLQLKGEIMDLDFTVDTDHRKRRRNRTTQSCLNCHTSKRKCDRKRPCQRCIQLGLTGLCVYEIDDPALRDDPSVDESTRLRNRIAELESLVRELRGKPHPRWADANFRDGDPSERWHSRAAKTNTHKRRRSSDDESDDRPTPESRGAPSSPVSPAKSDHGSEIVQPQLYRFSASPPVSYGFQSEGSGSPVSPYDRQPAQQYEVTGDSSASRTAVAYSTPATSPTVSYNGHHHQHHHHHAESYQDTSNVYSTLGSHACADDRIYSSTFAAETAPAPTYCPCRSSSSTGHPLIALSHQLQSTVNALRQYPHHSPDSQCQLYKRVVDLSDLMHGHDPDETVGTPYGTLPTPAESEILSSHSSASTPFPGSSAASSASDWNAIANSGFNSYFPLTAADQHLYNTVIT